VDRPCRRTARGSSGRGRPRNDSTIAGPMKTLAVAAMSLTLSGGVAAPGDRAVIQVTGARPQKALRLYLVSWHDFFVLHPVGTMRPDARGRATLIFRLPQLDADVYLPAVRIGGDLVRGRGRIAVRAAPPTGFTPLGAPAAHRRRLTPERTSSAPRPAPSCGRSSASTRRAQRSKPLRRPMTASSASR